MYASSVNRPAFAVWLGHEQNTRSQGQVAIWFLSVWIGVDRIEFMEPTWRCLFSRFSKFIPTDVVMATKRKIHTDFNVNRKTHAHTHTRRRRRGQLHNERSFRSDGDVTDDVTDDVTKESAPSGGWEATERCVTSGAALNGRTVHPPPRPPTLDIDDIKQCDRG